MIIRAADLDPQGVEIDVPLDLDPLSSYADEAIAVDGVVLRARIVPRRGGLALRGRLSARASVPCARCLAPFPVIVDSLIDVHYAAAPPPGKDIQIPDEELDCGFLDEGGILDLRQVASEQIYLELPMKPLCSPACRGLCPRCGGDLNKGACRCEALRSIS